METRQGKAIRALWRVLARAAVAAVCGLPVTPSLALAQAPDRGIAQVETWHGLRRVDLRGQEAVPPKREAEAPPASPSPDKSRVSAAVPAVSPPLPPALPAPESRAEKDGPRPRDLPQAVEDLVLPASASGQIVPGVEVRMGSGVRPVSALVVVQAQPAPPPAPAPAKQADLVAAPLPPAPAARQDVRPPAPRAERPQVEHIVAVKSESSSADELHRMAILQLLSVLAAILLAPLVLALVFFRLLRRSAGSTGPLFRVEFVGGQTGPVQPVIVTAPYAPAPAPAERPRAADEQPFLPRDPSEIAELSRSFDLGSTYEDEHRNRKQSEQEQHGALLKHIFEENMQLHEHLQGAAAE